MTLSNEHLQVKMHGLQGKLCDSLGHPTTFMTKLFFIFIFVWVLCFVLFLSFLLNFALFWGTGYKDRGRYEGTGR